MKQWGSNPRPLDYDSNTLPTEPHETLKYKTLTNTYFMCPEPSCVIMLP